MSFVQNIVNLVNITNRDEIKIIPTIIYYQVSSLIFNNINIHKIFYNINTGN